MVLKSDQQRVKDLLTETITLLCKNGLEYNRVFSIDALIGITLDEDDVFLVSIRDTITNETSRHDSESSFVRSRKSVPMKRVSSSPMQNKKKRLRPSSPDVSNLPLKLYKAADIQNQVDQYENKQNSDNNLALSNDYVTLADDENGEHSEHTEENSQSNDVSSNKSPVQAASADIDSGQNMIGKIKQEVEDPEELRILKTETNDQLFADSFGDQAGCSWQSPTGVSNLSTQLQSSISHQRFDRDIKMKVVERYKQLGNKVQTGLEFGVSEGTVRAWVKRYEKENGPIVCNKSAEFAPLHLNKSRKEVHVIGEISTLPYDENEGDEVPKQKSGNLNRDRYLEFGEAVVERYMETGNKMQTGLEFGVAASTVRAWIKRYERENGPIELTKPLDLLELATTESTDQDALNVAHVENTIPYYDNRHDDKVNKVDDERNANDGASSVESKQDSGSKDTGTKMKSGDRYSLLGTKVVERYKQLGNKLQTSVEFGLPDSTVRGWIKRYEKEHGPVMLNNSSDLPSTLPAAQLNSSEIEDVSGELSTNDDSISDGIVEFSNGSQFESHKDTDTKINSADRYALIGAKVVERYKQLGNKVQTGLEFGVSDSTVRTWIRRYEKEHGPLMSSTSPQFASAQPSVHRSALEVVPVEDVIGDLATYHENTSGNIVGNSDSKRESNKDTDTKIKSADRYALIGARVVERYLQLGNKVKTGLEFGVPESTVRAWIKRYEKEHGPVTPEKSFQSKKSKRKSKQYDIPTDYEQLPEDDTLNSFEVEETSFARDDDDVDHTNDLA